MQAVRFNDDTLVFGQLDTQRYLFMDDSLFSVVTLECANQFKAVHSIRELYFVYIEHVSVLKLSVFGPFMIISMISVSIMLVLCLLNQKLISTFFGKCINIYALNSILSQLAYIL